MFHNILHNNLFWFLVFVLRAAPAAYGSSQARGQIGARADGHSHSNARSEPHLQPTLQLVSTPDV